MKGINYYDRETNTQKVKVHTAKFYPVDASEASGKDKLI